MLSENGEASRGRDPGGDIIVSAGESRREWYAVYTMSRHEKRVAAHCERIAIEHFLPLYTWRRSWKNRTKIDLQMPLFPELHLCAIVAGGSRSADEAAWRAKHGGQCCRSGGNPGQRDGGAPAGYRVQSD